MSFVSYAQNREDVLLWRALGHIKNGFYIDVGANDPVHDSVTLAFYERGWWGINIEPVPSLHQRLAEQRPRDVNLGEAAGAADAEITLFDLPEVNGWATASAEVAAAHRADGHKVVESTVAVRTLNAICFEHVRGEIQFLKIDVEGFEEDVLRGIDLARWRPWVVVVEATMPNSRDTNHERWEGLITGQRYQFAWFDGLNRYYVAAEHPELMAALSTPPNVFDDFIPAQLDQAWRQLTELSAQHEKASLDLYNATARAEQAAQMHALTEQRLASAVHASGEAAHAANAALQLVTDLEARSRDAEVELARLHQAYAHEHAALAKTTEAYTRSVAHAAGLEQRVLAIQASTSWRLTAPLRLVGRVLRPLRPQGLLRRIVMRAMAIPRLRQLALRVLHRSPRLAALVRGRVAAIVHPVPAARAAQYVPPAHLIHVPLAARKVLHDLEQECAAQAGPAAADGGARHP